MALDALVQHAPGADAEPGADHDADAEAVEGEAEEEWGQTAQGAVGEGEVGERGWGGGAGIGPVGGGVGRGVGVGVGVGVAAAVGVVPHAGVPPQMFVRRVGCSYAASAPRGPCLTAPASRRVPQGQ
ncbi:hypothetical protein GCM10010349_22630 [Streptomyces flavofungini]|nr:hypothetical protein GCM10010349_22630 [Streptomyces flavofungini]